MGALTAQRQSHVPGLTCPALSAQALFQPQVQPGSNRGQESSPTHRGKKLHQRKVPPAPAPQKLLGWRLSSDFLPQKAGSSRYPCCEVAAPGLQVTGEPDSVPGVELQRERWCLGFHSPRKRAPEACRCSRTSRTSGQSPPRLGGSAASSSEGGVPKTTGKKESTRGSEIELKVQFRALF